MNRVQSGLLLITVGALVFTVDRLSKLWVVSNLDMYESVIPIPALVPYFQITRSFNTGAAFGIGAGTPFASMMFFMVSVGIILFLLVSYPRLESVGARVATAMIIGGASGNVVDRLLYGHVVDWVHVSIPSMIANVSNLADHAIVLGVCVLLYLNWRQPQPAPQDSPPTPTT
ncbi:MAG: signal peptidase II [Phototrophicaceae bacterium]